MKIENLFTDGRIPQAINLDTLKKVRIYLKQMEQKPESVLAVNENNISVGWIKVYLFKIMGIEGPKNSTLFKSDDYYTGLILQQVGDLIALPLFEQDELHGEAKEFISLYLNPEGCSLGWMENKDIPWDQFLEVDTEIDVEFHVL